MADENVYELPVNNYPLQVQNFEFMGYNVQMTLRYNAVGVSWSFDLYDNVKGDYIVLNEGLSVAMPSLYYSDLPFVFMMTDSTGLGCEVISIDEMGDRIGIVVMGAEAYENAIR